MPLYHSAYLPTWPYLRIMDVTLIHPELQPTLRPAFWPSCQCPAVHPVLSLLLCQSTARRSRELAGPTLSQGSPMSYTSCLLDSTYRHPYDLHIVADGCLWPTHRSGGWLRFSMAHCWVPLDHGPFAPLVPLDLVDLPRSSQLLMNPCLAVVRWEPLFPSAWLFPCQASLEFFHII